MCKLSTTTRFVLVVTLTIFPATLRAQGTDVVEVTNGDRITGDVSRLERGSLAFRTAAAGTIEIAWTEVITLTSTRNLEIELTSGAVLIGSISSPSAGRIVVQQASGPAAPIELKEILRISTVGATFRARTTGSIDFGLNYTHAESATNYSLSGEATNRGRVYEMRLSFDSSLARRDDADNLTRNDFLFEYDRFLANRWYALGRFELQQDDDLDLDLRLLAAGGVGRRLVQRPDMLLSVDGGLDYDGEWYSDEDSTDNSVEVFGGTDWEWFPNGSTQATLDADAYVSLERERFRLELDANVHRDIFRNLYWAVNVFDSYDSDPPGDRGNSSLGLSFTFGWAF